MTIPTSSLLAAPAAPTTVPVSLWKLTRRSDDSLSESDDSRLRSLLRACFPFQAKFYLRRSLQNTPPLYRWFAAYENENAPFVAHAALYEKIIETANGPLKIGAVTEVCVNSHHRGKGIVRMLLTDVHQTLIERRVDFSMLFGQERIYRSSGYKAIENPVTATNSLLRHWNPFCGLPLVASLADKPWPDGPIDLQGPTF